MMNNILASYRQEAQRMQNEFKNQMNALESTYRSAMQQQPAAPSQQADPILSILTEIRDQLGKIVPKEPEPAPVAEVIVEPEKPVKNEAPKK